MSCINLTATWERDEESTPRFVPLESLPLGEDVVVPDGDFLVAYYGFGVTRKTVANLTRDCASRGQYLEVIRLKVDVARFLEGGTVHLDEIHTSRLLNIVDASVELRNAMIEVIEPEVRDTTHRYQLRRTPLPAFLARYPVYLDSLRRSASFKHITVYILPGPAGQALAFAFPGSTVVDAYLMRTAACPVLLPEWIDPVSAPAPSPLPKKPIKARPAEAKPAAPAKRKQPAKRNAKSD